MRAFYALVKNYDSAVLYDTDVSMCMKFADDVFRRSNYLGCGGNLLQVGETRGQM